MTYLFIYSEDTVLSQLSSFITSNYPTDEYFTFNTITNSLYYIGPVSLTAPYTIPAPIKKDFSIFLDSLPQLDLLLVTPKRLSSMAVFLSSVLITHNVLTLTSSPFFNQTCFKSCQFTKNIHYISRLPGLLSYLKTNYSSLLASASCRKAKERLLDLNIPFTIEHLIEAIKMGDVGLTSLFIQAGLSVNSCDNNGTPLLNIACREGKIDIVKFLISHNATVDIISKDRGYTPLLDAVFTKNYDIVKYLLTQNAAVNFRCKEGQTPLIIAVGQDNLPLCKLLVENKADVNIKDDMGMSALSYAALFKKEELIALLSS